MVLSRQPQQPEADVCGLLHLQLGGSGVLVQPMTYIFDEEPARWRTVVEELGLPEDVVSSIG